MNEETFNRRKRTSQYWLNKAKDFNASAYAIFEAIKNEKSKYLTEKLGVGHDLRCSLRPIFGFLCGIALELLIKASFVEIKLQEKVRKIFQETKKIRISEDEIEIDLKKEFFSHDLNELARQINLQLTEQDVTLLTLYTHFIRWQGRYPIPIDQQESIKFSKIDIFLAQEHQIFKKFNPKLMLSMENYEMLWNKFYQHYFEISENITSEIHFILEHKN